ncbi:MAG: TIGR02757 family protein [Fibrobacter sp.]|nr:TIGR02757 family protein [Fibrobacter sp.]
MKCADLNERLNSIFNQYHKAEYLRTDPLQCVYPFKADKDREISGLVAALMAYGRVEIIIRNLNVLFQCTGPDIVDFTLNTTYSKKLKVFKGFKHRFNDHTDISILFQSIAEIIEKYGSIEALFVEAGQVPVVDALNQFSSKMKALGEKIGKESRKSFQYLFPSPSSGSACKRLNMYLRWMVRPKDSIDLGIWRKVSPSVLIIPVDTHIAQIARNLKLTSRKNADWKMAEEITASLRKFDPFDPVKYDFSLCRAGMISVRKDAA